MKTILTNPRFPLGNIVATPAAMDTFTQEEQMECLSRHASCDWGDMDADDKESNDHAVMHGSRILSAYRYGNRTLWVITESSRECTTLLLPSDY